MSLQQLPCYKLCSMPSTPCMRLELFSKKMRRKYDLFKKKMLAILTTTFFKGKEEKNAIAVCNFPCMHYSTCSTCLEVADCRWSSQLDECISASYQSMYCAGGVCGLVLQTDDRQYCPEPCKSFTQCSTCLTHVHCGWCAVPGLNGQGVCTEGSNDRPMSGTCTDVFKENKDLLVRPIICYEF